MKTWHNTTKTWHISYKAKTDSYPESIVWCVDLVGTLAEAINKLHELDRVTEIVDIYETE